jgi:hypothetical protein
MLSTIITGTDGMAIAVTTSRRRIIATAIMGRGIMAGLITLRGHITFRRLITACGLTLITAD